MNEMPRSIERLRKTPLTQKYDEVYDLEQIFDRVLPEK